MAGDDNRDRVAMVGHADGTKCVRLAYGACDVCVGARLSEGNRQQRAPAGKLEICAAKVEREVEPAPLASEILFDLACVKSHRAGGILEPESLFLFLLLSAKIAWVRPNRLLSSQSGIEFQGDKSVGGRCQKQRPNG